MVLVFASLVVFDLSGLYEFLFHHFELHSLRIHFLPLISREGGSFKYLSILLKSGNEVRFLSELMFSLEPVSLIEVLGIVHHRPSIPDHSISYGSSVLGMFMI